MSNIQAFSNYEIDMLTITEGGVTVYKTMSLIWKVR